MLICLQSFCCLETAEGVRRTRKAKQATKGELLSFLNLVFDSQLTYPIRERQLWMVRVKEKNMRKPQRELFMVLKVTQSKASGQRYIQENNIKQNFKL